MRKAARVTHAQFAMLVDAMRKHRQLLLDTRPSEQETCKFLQEKVNIPVGRATISELKEVSGVKWVTKRMGNATADSVRRNAIRTLTVSLHRLYVDLGKPVPQILHDLFNEIEQR